MTMSADSAGETFAGFNFSKIIFFMMIMMIMMMIMMMMIYDHVRRLTKSDSNSS